MKKVFLLLALLPAVATAQPTLESLDIQLAKSIDCNPVEDQYLSSTCWSFASNSFIESELMRRSALKINLSEMYVARYAYINKVYQYLALKGNVYFTPGGQFHDVLKVVKSYGIVPEYVYNGKPKGERDHNQAELDTLMHHFVQSLLKQGKTKLSAADLKYINDLLDTHLGKVPKHFLYQGKQYTPLAFTKQVLGFNADDYVELTSYTHHPYYRYFVLEDKYNWSNDKYFNIPLNEFVQITETALEQGYTVCWDGDVSEPGFLYERGIAYLDKPFENDVVERQTTFNDKSSALDHMMQITGVATDKEKKRWYYIKNSWGSNTNNLGGYLYMSANYLKIKTMAIIVNKHAIPAPLRKNMKLLF